MSKISDHDLNMLILNICKDGLLKENGLEPHEEKVLSTLKELQELREAKPWPDMETFISAALAEIDAHKCELGGTYMARWAYDYLKNFAAPSVPSSVRGALEKTFSGGGDCDLNLPDGYSVEFEETKEKK